MTGINGLAPATRKRKQREQESTGSTNPTTSLRRSLRRRTTDTRGQSATTTDTPSEGTRRTSTNVGNRNHRPEHEAGACDGDRVAPTEPNELVVLDNEDATNTSENQPGCTEGASANGDNRIDLHDEEPGACDDEQVSHTNTRISDVIDQNSLVNTLNETRADLKEIKEYIKKLRAEQDEFRRECKEAHEKWVKAGDPEEKQDWHEAKKCAYNMSESIAKQIISNQTRLNNLKRKELQLINYVKSKVGNLKNRYDFLPSEKFSKFANELKEAKWENRGHGVQFLDISANPIDKDQGGVRVITRKHSRGACDQALAYLIDDENSTRAVLTGSPGSGKSMSLIYAMKKCFERDLEVMFASRKHSYYIWFKKKKDGKYEAKFLMESQHGPHLAAGKGSILLIDPLDAGNDLVAAISKLFVACSKNPLHYKHWDKCLTTRMFFFICLSIEELLEYLKLLPDTNLTEKEVRDRYRIVGGHVRYVFFDSMYQQRVKEMEVKTVSSKEVMDLLNSLADGENIDERNVLTLFATHQLIQEENDNFSEQEDSDQKDVDYTKARIIPNSDFSRLKLVQKVIGRAYDKIVNNTERALSSFYGIQFEDLAHAHLLNSGTFTTAKLSNRGYIWDAVQLDVQTDCASYVTDREAMLKRMKRALVDGVVSERKLWKCPNNFFIADFVDGKGNLFNVTINKYHSISKEGIQKIQESLEKDGKPFKGVVKLFWIVPDTSHFRAMKMRPVPEKYEHLIEQYLLFIPRDFQGTAVSNCGTLTLELNGKRLGTKFSS